MDKVSCEFKIFCFVFWLKCEVTFCFMFCWLEGFKFWLQGFREKNKSLKRSFYLYE